MQQSTDSATIASYILTSTAKSLSCTSYQNSYRKFPAYYAQKFASDSFDLKALQRNIPGNNTAVITYFMSDTTLTCFVIKRSDLRYFSKQPTRLFIRRSLPHNRLKQFRGNPQNELAKLPLIYITSWYYPQKQP